MGTAKKAIFEGIDEVFPGFGTELKRTDDLIMKSLPGTKELEEGLDELIGDPLLEAVGAIDPEEEEDKPEAADPRTKDVSLLGPGDVRLGKGGDEATSRTKSGKRKLSRPGS